MSNYSDLPSETDSIDQVDATAASTGDQVLFWPFMIVVFTFILLNVLQLVNVLQVGNQLQSNIAQLNPVVGRSQQVTAVLEKVSRDILNLAPSNSNADRIRKEFGIRDNGVPTPPSASSDSSATPAK